ncbi:hypothetical protein AGDE_15451 [Angomonas deanei]|uniref:Uncharacterized protein n=1 Tax=Angomonas deanei TaxID=59799 RepID=A0A7G2CPG0_9TRYP|nr:hypothetical protein AGDE_15451 [Angomonas deanei]CAD2221670.1 hypothetical protein, conserved [Angomonas deanei]|eukprot:EPY19044.1 hypothetical protein AGDE_15451 [Angomonas deanei]
MSHPTKYTPHSEVTRSHYEKLLYDVRQCVPSTTDYEEVEELAEEVLRLVCSRGQGSQNNTISKEDILVVKQRLERIFGTPVSPEMENNFLNYRHLITDYVVTADTAEEDGSGDVDVAVGGGPSSSEGSSEEDEVNFLAGNKMSKKKQLKKDKNLEQYAFEAIPSMM